MTWTSDPDNAGFTTSGTLFRPLADNRAGFSVEAALTESDSILSFYRKMIGIRNNHRALQEGDFQLLHQNRNSIAFTRNSDSETILVAINYGSKKETISFCDISEERLEPLLMTEPNIHFSGSQLQLPDKSMVVYWVE